jgi:hypothetical protein
VSHRRKNLCAQLAAQAVYAHQSNLQGSLLGEILNPEEALANLLIDLRHWCDREKLSFERINEDAQAQYAHELFHG